MTIGGDVIVEVESFKYLECFVQRNDGFTPKRNKTYIAFLSLWFYPMQKLLQTLQY